VLLPAAYFTLRQTTPPPVALLRAAGVPMAVATDSQSGDFALHLDSARLNMACTLFGLTPEEALERVRRARRRGPWVCGA
jgi:imidazolonepropionase